MILNKVKEKFYGTVDINKIIIITPISEIYKKILSILSNKKQYSGWRRICNAELLGTNVTLIKSQQGYLINDILYSVKNDVKIIFF